MSLSNSSNTNINSPSYDKSGRAGMQGHTPVHRLVFVRHGETEANNALMGNANIDHMTLDTCLTTTGVAQGEEIADFLRTIKFKPDNIFCSNLSRAYNTAYPTISQFENINVIVSKEWREFNKKREELVFDKVNGVEWIYEKETLEEFIERVSNEFNKLKIIGTISQPVQSIIFTHSQVISAILLKCMTNVENLSTCNDVSIHLANGSITCIDIDETQQIHIHTVNYTRHLSEPTGQHMPFV